MYTIISLFTFHMCSVSSVNIQLNKEAETTIMVIINNYAWLMLCGHLHELSKTGGGL